GGGHSWSRWRGIGSKRQCNFIVSGEGERYWLSLAAPPGDSHVRSNGFAAGLRAGRAHLRAAARDGGNPPQRPGQRGNENPGHRARRAELAEAGDPDRQLLPQPVRAAAVVLRADRDRPAAAARRSLYRADVL